MLRFKHKISAFLIATRIVFLLSICLYVLLLKKTERQKKNAWSKEAAALVVASVLACDTCS